MDVVGIISGANNEKLDRLFSTVERVGFERYGQVLRVVRRNEDTILFASPSARIIEDEDIALALAGYTTSGDDDILRILRPVTTSGRVGDENTRPVVIADSLGGTHCIAAVGGFGGATWGSMPGCAPPYAAVGDGFTIACNRPGILKSALDLVSNPEYWRWIATVGYPIDDTSPYMGARCVLGGTALRTSGGLGTIVDYVLPPHGTLPQTPDEAATAEDAVRAELLRATAAIGLFKNVEFRLSGGKDSRMVASALSVLGIKCTAFTDGAREGKIAAAIALEARIPHVNILEREAPVVAPADLIDRAITSLRRTDGLVSLHGDLALDLRGNSIPGQDARLQGQIELHKGGYAKGRVRFEHSEAVERLERFVIPAHVEDRSGYARKLAERFDLSGYATPLDILYFPYAATRASRHLEVSYREISYHCTPIYPPNDERMYMAVANVDRRRRATEEMMYGIIKKNSPQIATIPIFGDVWRFQKAGPVSDQKEALTEQAPDRSIGSTPWARRFMIEYVRSNKEILEVAQRSLRSDFLHSIGLKDERPVSEAVPYKRVLRTKVLMRLFVMAVAADNWESF